MKLFADIKEGNPFTKITEFGKVSLIKTDLKDGKNIRCMKSENGTYIKGHSYFMLWNEEVIETI